MTTISHMIGQAHYNAGSVAPAGGHQAPTHGPRVYDGYSSLGGSVLRNTAIGAAAGAVVGVASPLTLPLTVGAGAAIGAGSALIRHPRVSSAVGDGMKAAMSGAAGGAVVGAFTPMGPLPGAAAGAIGGFVTGTASGLLRNVAGGRFSIENETSVWGRVKKGLALGAASGAAIGAGAGLMFGGIGAVPGALMGAAIGGIGGAIHGATTGVTDAATGAKGVTFGGGIGFKLPHLGRGTSRGDTPGQVGQYPHQQYPQQGHNPQQSVLQCPMAA